MERRQSCTSPAPAKSARERLDAFPTQLVLTIAWVVIGTPLCLHYHDSVLLVLLLSVYAIVISHWTGHLSWAAKRAARKAQQAQERQHP